MLLFPDQFHFTLVNFMSFKSDLLVEETVDQEDEGSLLEAEEQDDTLDHIQVLVFHGYQVMIRMTMMQA